MPLPKSKNVGTTMKVLQKEGGRPHAQMIAIAIENARKNGANIPEKKDKIKGIDKKVLAMKKRASKK